MRINRPYILVQLGALLLATAATAGAAPTAEPRVTTNDLAVGSGAEVVPYSKVQVHYTGWLEDGTQFDSSRDREPFEIQVGAGQVIPGWEMGLQGMRAGGKRELVIPPQLAYGRSGAGGVIPPNATLKFEVEVLSAEPPPFAGVGNGQLSEKLKKGVKIVDIRRPDEWKTTGVVEGSILLTAFDGRGRFVPDFPSRLAEAVDKEEEVILICRTGNRTGVLANALATQGGYSRVVNVTDGITRWIAEGGAVVKP